ncbi:MAG: iron chaperone [Flavobacteriales bacterium]
MHPEIAAHIAQFPAHTQEKLKALHAFICDQVPGLTEKMAYGIPTFQLNGKNFIHYAGHSKHIGLYPGSKGIAAFTAAFEQRKFKYSKGAVQFPLKEELPLDLVAEILGYLINKS